MRQVVLLFLIVFTLISCDRALVFEENRSLEDAVWSQDEVLRFDVNVSDTISLHNMYINLRNGSEYAFSNIYMFVEIHFPNGKKSVDTLECPLASPEGRWYGSGLGDIYDNRFLYVEKKAFPLPGKYEIAVHQAMRDKELEEIYDVGFRVSKSN